MRCPEMPIRTLALGLATAALAVLSGPIRRGHDAATRQRERACGDRSTPARRGRTCCQPRCAAVVSISPSGPDHADDTLFASCGSYDQPTVYRFVRASGGPVPEIVLREPAMGRTSLAIAPSSPDTMYALSASHDPGPGGNYEQALLAVFRSDRGGVAGSWQARVTNADPVRLNTLLLTNVGGASVQECSGGSASNTFTNWAGTPTSSPSIRALPIGCGLPASTGFDRTTAGGRAGSHRS